MKRLLFVLLFLNPGIASAYTLQGEENDLAHGAVGYGGTLLVYGLVKRLVCQDRKPTLDEKIGLMAIATVLNFGVALLKEASDDSKCRNSGGSVNGCFDMGAVGYGMLGVAAANASILVFDF